jgi:hypothetical protein
VDKSAIYNSELNKHHGHKALDMGRAMRNTFGLERETTSSNANEGLALVARLCDYIHLAV